MKTYLDTLEQTGKDATEGPWEPEDGRFSMTCGAIWHVMSTPYNASPKVFKQERDNATFICLSRNVWPELMRVVRAAKDAAEFQVSSSDRAIAQDTLRESLAALESKMKGMK